jgi:hypothetical protein
MYMAIYVREGAIEYMYVLYSYSAQTKKGGEELEQKTNEHKSYTAKNTNKEYNPTTTKKKHIRIIEKKCMFIYAIYVSCAKKYNMNEKIK